MHGLVRGSHTRAQNHMPVTRPIVRAQYVQYKGFFLLLCTHLSIQNFCWCCCCTTACLWNLDSALALQTCSWPSHS